MRKTDLTHDLTVALLKGDLSFALQNNSWALGEFTACNPQNLISICVHISMQNVGNIITSLFLHNDIGMSTNMYANLLVNYELTDGKILQIPSKRPNEDSTGEAEEVNIVLV